MAEFDRNASHTFQIPERSVCSIFAVPVDIPCLLWRFVNKNGLVTD